MNGSQPTSVRWRRPPNERPRSVAGSVVVNANAVETARSETAKSETARSPVEGRWLRAAAICLLWFCSTTAAVSLGQGTDFKTDVETDVETNVETNVETDAEPASPRVADSDPISAYLAQRIQNERIALGLQPFLRHPDVQAVAQTFADEVVRSGSWLGVDLSADRAAALLEARGYIYFEITTTYYAGGAGEPGPWVDSWMVRARHTFDNLHNPSLQHLGIGSADFGRLRFYYLIAATSRVAYYLDATRPLSDLSKVREQVLTLVNQERRKLRLRPLDSHPALDRVAQKYAEDMLERGFYGHTSPEGKSVRDRVNRIGYEPPRVAENLGSGQTGVEQVMEGWMASPGHRANILHRKLREIGTGMALGEKDGDFKILWVQVFAGKR